MDEMPMKKTIISIIYSICFVAIMCLTNFGHINFAHAEEPQNRTVFMISPTLIASATNKTYVYDSTDLSIKKIEPIANNSTSYYIGQIKDICAYDDTLFMLTDSGLKLFDTTTFEISEIDLDFVTSSYTHLNISNVNNKTIIAIYGDTISISIQTAEYTAGEVPEFHAVTIADSAHGDNVAVAKYIYFDDTEYLIRASESHILFYPLVISSDTSLNTTTIVVDGNGDSLEDIDNIVGINFNGNLLITYKLKTNLYSLNKTASNITATLVQSKSHNYSSDEPVFEAKNTSLSGDNLYILSTDCYFVLHIADMQFTGKTSNAICEENYFENKTDYKYYKVTAQTNLISKLGNSNFVDVPENAFVVEIATSTLSDDTALVGYKFVVYAKVDENGQYQNYYGYIIDDNCLHQIEVQNSTAIAHVFDQTKIYSYPSIYVAEQFVEHQNKVEHLISSSSPVNVIALLGEYQTGNGEDAVSYALVDNNGHVGFIDISKIVSSDKRVINTMPNAVIIAGTDVYEQADNQSAVIAHLETSKNVRIIGLRDKNGYIKIAFNSASGKYYEGYILASRVRANSYTIMQTIGAVLVILNVLLLSILIATKKRIVQ